MFKSNKIMKINKFLNIERFELYFRKNFGLKGDLAIYEAPSAPSGQ